MKFSHFTNTGKAKMVDISKKDISLREAMAKAVVYLNPKTIKLIKSNKILKGDCLTVAKIAAINSAKKVSDLIPLTHPLNIEHVDVNFSIKKNAIEIFTAVKLQAKTGAEMEALTSACIAALTIYDMCKAVDKNIEIREVKLLEKIKK